MSEKTGKRFKLEASGVKVLFDVNVPDGCKELLAERLGPYVPLLSREIRLLHVMLKGANMSDVNGEAATMCIRRYHTAAIAFDPSFFELDAEEQERTAAHEVVHVLHNQFSSEVVVAVKAFVPETVHEFLMDRLDEMEERVVDRIGDALYDIMHRR